jgi:hypothetical protein
MELLIIYIPLIVITLFIAKRFAKKEEKKFYEENDTFYQSTQIEDIDTEVEALVHFKFKTKPGQYMVQSAPNIFVYDNDGHEVEKHKMNEKNVLTLKLPAQAKIYFGVPYLGKDIFKSEDVFDFEVGAEYVIEYKAKVFVFQKPKVTITKMGLI